VQLALQDANRAHKQCNGSSHQADATKQVDSKPSEGS
jgi:hypothetical protein